MRYQFYLPDGLTFQDYLEFSHLSYRKFPQPGLIRGRRSLCFTGGLSLAVGLGMAVLYLGRMSLIRAIITGFLILLGVWILYKYGFSFFKYSAADTMRKTRGQRGAVTFTLDEDGVENSTGDSSYRCEFDDVRHIYSIGGLYVLLSVHGAAFLLPRRALVAGDPDGLEDFLRTKTGCAIEEVAIKK